MYLVDNLVITILQTKNIIFFQHNCFYANKISFDYNPFSLKIFAN